MKIIDLNGDTIVVDDLEKAIDLADYFKDAHHVPMVGNGQDNTGILEGYL